MSRCRRVWRGHRGEVETLAGLGAHPGRVDETVATHKDAVVHCREIGNDVAPLSAITQTPIRSGR
jgi:hypothetical protein